MGELVARSEADLLDIRNFGAKSITEVKEKLAELGLTPQGQRRWTSTRPAAALLRAATTGDFSEDEQSY